MRISCTNSVTTHTHTLINPGICYELVQSKKRAISFRPFLFLRQLVAGFWSRWMPSVNSSIIFLLNEGISSGLPQCSHNTSRYYVLIYCTLCGQELSTTATNVPSIADNRPLVWSLQKQPVSELRRNICT